MNESEWFGYFLLVLLPGLAAINRGINNSIARWSIIGIVWT